MSPTGPWKKIWRIRGIYSTPRDEIPWLKLQHRNLWVAKHGGHDSDKCCAHGCNEIENQEHLGKCPIIREDFWRRIIRIMRILGLEAENTDKFIITGTTGPNEVLGRESASVMFIAWRCLYAEIVGARTEERNLRLESAYARTIGMLLGRVKAHGYKWRRWVLRNRFKQPLVKKVIPQKHQVKKLISMDLQGNGTICKRLIDEFQNVRRHTTYTR